LLVGAADLEPIQTSLNGKKQADQRIGDANAAGVLSGVLRAVRVYHQLVILAQRDEVTQLEAEHLAIDGPALA
jgi:hypothetical protein